MNKTKKYILFLVCSFLVVALIVIGGSLYSQTDLFQAGNTIETPSDSFENDEASTPDAEIPETETDENGALLPSETQTTEEFTEESTDESTEEFTEESTESEEVDPSTLLRHAPNMYIDWEITGNIYDAITIDWKCTEDTPETYWAVHNWSTYDTMGGYAGFQTRLDGEHVILLSLWDLPDGTIPTIEYHYDKDVGYGDFGGEGEGKQVFTKYNWKVNTWYSMKIERLYENGKTYFTQYVREGSGEWLKTACISYPVKYDAFSGSSLFQEDFGFTNRRRSCEVRNAGGRIENTNEWEMWSSCTVSNSFYPEDGEYGVVQGISNVNFNCDYKNNGNSIWLQSGGYDDAPRGKEYPITEYLN